MSSVDINAVLSQMRRLEQQTQMPAIEKNVSNIESRSGKLSFESLLEKSINSVNSEQLEASRLKKAYEMGEAGLSLTEVMVASQKANLSFQALMQTRNKLLDAYRDIMNMSL